jgi:prepilin-type N-terminal cleavage/methylation domain-containing protein
MFKSVQKGFTLIEILIVITVIGVLAGLALQTMGGIAGPRARDATRISSVQQIATMVSSLQNRFHVPPLAGEEFTKKYPEECRGGDFSNLAQCAVSLKIATPEEIEELFTDPKHGIYVGETEDIFNFKYAATANAFKVCVFMEDQGSFEQMNATNEGRKATVDDMTGTGNNAFMYCEAQGPHVWDTSFPAVSEVKNTVGSTE